MILGMVTRTLPCRFFFFGGGGKGVLLGMKRFVPSTCLAGAPSPHFLLLFFGFTSSDNSLLTWLAMNDCEPVRAVFMFPVCACPFCVSLSSSIAYGFMLP